MRLLLLASLLWLSACGQKGPLYFAPASEPAQSTQASIDQNDNQVEEEEKE